MPRMILFDEFHMSFFLPDDVTSEGADTVRRALDDPSFLSVLQEAVRRALAFYPDLTPLTVQVSL